ncbi:MAG: zinc-dependent metalloprotease [Candidatus Aminicenantes bacterium]|nr:MAG: zinc-dependent metalloprotease [Candidatus Aminicenantes bacterium]
MKKPFTVLFFCLIFLVFANFTFEQPNQQEKKEQVKETKKKQEVKKEEKKPPAKKEKTFEDVIKDAKKLDGLFNLYKKEDKLYLEILPKQFGKMYLFIPTLWTSVGYGGAGSYLAMRVFAWEKLDKKVLLLWKNTRYKARSPQYKRSLKNVVPQSIAHAFNIEGEPHPERKSILVALDDMFLADLANLRAMYSRQQNPYSVDRKRTVWGKIQAFPENIELEVRYTVASTKPRPEPSVPDSRAFTAHVRYSISEVPMNNGYMPRLADDRVGYFNTKVFDFDRNDIDGTAVRYINRWYLEKKDPRAKVSEPKEPIVFWLENTIPEEFRKAIKDGILEWNRAYEKAGFKNAMVVKQMPDDAKWDPADIRYNTIRWVVALTGGGGGAFGPSRINPFTGQILDADVVMFAPMNFIFGYNAIESPLTSFFFGEGKELLPGKISPWYMDNLLLGFERDYGIFAMLANGKIEDVKDVPKEYLYDFFKFLACHEVGHTLGLRHNFKGSTTIALKDLHNEKLTERESIGNSIMEYLPSNLAPKGVKQGDYWQKTIGAWDYWVIEYGYKPLNAKTSEDELPALDKIASRSNEPKLIYGADEDAYDFGPFSLSIDPTCVTWDLGADPLAYAEQDANRTRDLWKQLENRSLFEGRSYVYLRRGFEATLGRYFQAMSRIVKWVGGIYHVRAHVEDPGKTLPYRVVEYEKQRRALDIIKTNLLSADAFSFDPTFIRKLQIDRFFDFERWSDVIRAASLGRFRLDFSLANYLKTFYSSILRMLYDPMRLHRIQDNEMRTDGQKLTLGDYMSELYSAIWQEVREGKAVGNFRRILQREHLNRITGFVLKPPAPTPDDAIAIYRFQLKDLNKDIKEYLAKYPDSDPMTRAHLDNCSDIITETLKAVYTKSVK